MQLNLFLPTILKYFHLKTGGGFSLGRVVRVCALPKNKNADSKLLLVFEQLRSE